MALIVLDIPALEALFIHVFSEKYVISLFDLYSS